MYMYSLTFLIASDFLSKAIARSILELDAADSDDSPRFFFLFVDLDLEGF